MNRKQMFAGLRCLAAMLMLVLSVGCASTTLDSSLRRNTPADSVPEGASLAVVPFENLSTSRNAGLAVTDLAASVLYATHRFDLVEVSSLQDDKDVRFRRLEISPWERQIGVNTTGAAAIGRSLHAEFVLAGCVGEYGFIDGFGETATVGVTLRLVRSADAQVVWAGSLSRHSSTFAFSEESAHRLAHDVVRDLVARMIQDLRSTPTAHERNGP